jgi:hypothetical protein
MQDQTEIHEKLRKLIDEAALTQYLGNWWRFDQQPPRLSEWMRLPHASDMENLHYTNRHVLADMYLCRPFEEAAIAAGNFEEVATACHAITKLALDEIEAGRLDEGSIDAFLKERRRNINIEKKSFRRLSCEEILAILDAIECL